MSSLLMVTPSPHLHDNTNVKKVMWNVVIALLPALCVSVYYFGIKALELTCYGILAAVLTEALILYLRKKPIMINDGSAVITGMLVAFNVHTGVPWWIPVVGAVFAIAIGKHVFGGIGHNIVNPALLGRVFLMTSWPSYMTSDWTATRMNSINGMLNNSCDVISGATPLGVAELLRDPSYLETLRETGLLTANDIFQNLTDFPTLFNLFIGNVAGCIGEVSAIAILIGALYLLSKQIIEWRIPFIYLLTMFVLTYLLGGVDGKIPASINVPIFHILSGGLLLGVFFMATDPVTSPISKRGRIIFGIGCGIFTVVIRLYGAYPEGVSYAILIMNLFVPMIDKYTFPRVFGEVRK